jgi:hypothetical protein
MSGFVLVVVSALCLAALGFGLVSDLRRGPKGDAGKGPAVPAGQALPGAITSERAAAPGNDPWRMATEFAPPVVRTSVATSTFEAAAPETGALGEGPWRMAVQLPPPAAHAVMTNPSVARTEEVGIVLASAQPVFVRAETTEPADPYGEAGHLAVEGSDATEAAVEQVVQVAAEITRVAQAAVEAALAVRAAAEQIARAVPAATSAVRVVMDAATTASLEAEALEESVARIPGPGAARVAGPNRSGEAADAYMRGVA